MTTDLPNSDLHKNQQLECKDQLVENVMIDWKYEDTYTLTTVYNKDPKKNGMIKICKIGSDYSLNLQGSADQKQSCFKLYNSLVDLDQVKCLESVCYPGVYVSWDDDVHSLSVNAYVGCPGSPPDSSKCIGWNPVSPESLSGKWGNCIILRAWTSSPHDITSTSYYLSFGCQKLPNGNAASYDENYTAQLTTDKAISGNLVLSKFQVYDFDWKHKGTYTLTSVGNPDSKKNGMIQIRHRKNHYSLNLKGTTDEKQSHFRLYTAAFMDSHHVTCLESNYHPGVYISWYSISQNIGCHICSPRSPPKMLRSICWDQLTPKSLSREYPHSIVLRAWTASPQEHASYYLSFGGPVMLDRKTKDYTTKLTTNFGDGAAMVLTNCAEYRGFLGLTSSKVKNRPQLELDEQSFVWEDDGIHTLTTVGSPVGKENGRVKICQSGDKYVLNLYGDQDGTQSQFRLYHALVNGQWVVKCLRSVSYPDIYVSWNTRSPQLSIGFLKWSEDGPPKDNKYIAWSIVYPGTPNKDYPDSSLLQARTAFPPEGAGYYLSFGGQDPTSTDVDYIAELTTDKTNSSLIVIEKYTGV